MAIKIGNNTITLKVGSTDVSAAYLGSTLVYSGGTPPAPSYKWIATYTGGTTSSAECDASSAITNNEITKTNLQSVEIGQCVTSISGNAFNSCTSLTNITIPDSVTSIGDYAFFRCDGLSSVTIPNSVTIIGNNTFYQCNGLANITIPDSVTSIGQSVFGFCTGLTSVTIGSGVTSISQNAFQGCGLTGVTIPDSITTIGTQAFASCLSLTSATIGSGVTTIGDNAFGFCWSLPTITIPDSVTSIGNYAFYRCSGLTSVTVLATTPATLGTNVFNDTNNCPIYVPSQSVSAYQSATNWSSYTSRIQAIPEPSPQWVTFNNGDDISGLNIYGIKGNALVLSNQGIINIENDNYEITFTLNRNNVDIAISGCYTDTVPKTDDVEYIFSNVGCSDYFTVDANQTATQTFQLYIYQ
jgi:hypothetical protein